MRKSRKQKHDDYIDKFGDIPTDYRERLEWMYDNYKITESQAYNIMQKKFEIESSISYFDTKIVLFEIPEGAPRPRFRLINRSNIANAALTNPNFIHVYSITGKEDNMFMKRLMSEEDFTALEQVICTPCIVDIYTYLRTPSCYNKEEKMLAEIGMYRPISKPDWDNLGKKYSDMFNSNVWLDDTLVIDGAVHRYYSILPRVEIQIRYLNMVQNKHQYDSIVKRSNYNESYNLQYPGGKFDEY